MLMKYTYVKFCQYIFFSRTHTDNVFSCNTEAALHYFVTFISTFCLHNTNEVCFPQDATKYEYFCENAL